MKAWINYKISRGKMRAAGSMQKCQNYLDVVKNGYSLVMKLMNSETHS